MNTIKNLSIYIKMKNTINASYYLNLVLVLISSPLVPRMLTHEPEATK